MLAIRLTRTGKIHAPHYRIVVQEKRSKLDGKAVDIIGHYHPADKDKKLVIDHEKAKLWLGRGAQPSDTVTNLFVKEGLLDESKKVHHFYTPKPKEEAPVAEEAPAAEASEESAEATEAEPTEEAAAEEPEAEAKAEEAEASPAEEPAAETEEKEEAAE